jgi:hypothetical protein
MKTSLVKEKTLKGIHLNECDGRAGTALESSCYNGLGNMVILRTYCEELNHIYSFASLANYFCRAINAKSPECICLDELTALQELREVQYIRDGSFCLTTYTWHFIHGRQW